MNLSRDIVQFTMTVTSNNNLLFLILRTVFDKREQLQNFDFTLKILNSVVEKLKKKKKTRGRDF